MQKKEKENIKPQNKLDIQRKLRQKQKQYTIQNKNGIFEKR